MARSRGLTFTLALAALAVSLTAHSDGALANIVINNQIIPVDWSGFVGRTPSIALDAAGNPVISYHDLTNGDLKVLHCGDATCGSGNVSAILDPFGAREDSASLALDANGYPVVSYVNFITDDLWVIHCGDPYCSAGNVTEPVDGVGIYWGWTSVALDGTGRPVVAYYDSANDALKVVRCGDAFCSAGNSIVTVDTSGGSQPAMVLDSADNPVVAYQASGHLSVLHCGNPTCTTGNTVVVADSSANVGQQASVTLDSAEKPIVSYLDGENSDLKLLHCGSLDCATGNTISVPETDVPFGGMPIAVDGQDNPIVAYWRVLTSELRLLHCGDPACSSGNSVSSVDRLSGGYYYKSIDFVLDADGLPVIAYQSDDPADLWLVHCTSIDCTQDDSDGDGCSDSHEAFVVPAYQTLGGLRDPKNPNDYFNPTHDGQNRVDDILAVVDAYFMDDADGNPGLPPYTAGYSPDTDRTLIGPNAWNLGPPNGLQRVDDILNIVKQYFHDCS